MILPTFKKLEGPKLLSIDIFMLKKGKIDNYINSTSKFSGLQCYLIDKKTAKYLMIILIC